MANISIDNKIFDFVFGCALVDAVQMRAYPYEHKPKTHEYPQAVECVKKLVHKVIGGEYADQKNDQAQFDADFFATVLELKKEIPNFTFGNAQKLLNMTFKHMYTMAYLNDEMKHNFDVCHCPVDSIMLDKVWRLVQEVDNKKELLATCVKAGEFKKSWSQEDFSTLEKYEGSRYMIFQNAVRQLADAKSCSPIEFDFFVWQ